MIYASGSPLSIEMKGELESLLDDYLTEDDEIAVVIGGDGFFFEMAKTLPQNTLMVPLNGGSLGYTLNDVSDLKETAKLINLSNWTEYEFRKLDIFLKRNEEYDLVDTVANDIYVERASGQTARLCFSIDGTPMLSEPVICDAIILSTALGSTAYALSAGGPICHPALQTIGITLSNAHYPRIPPMIVPRTSTIDVTAEDQRKRPIRIICDGRELNYKKKINRFYVEGIRVSQSKEFIRVAYLNGHDLNYQLAKKIIRR